jgi:hypothetical protein
VCFVFDAPLTKKRKASEGVRECVCFVSDAPPTEVTVCVSICALECWIRQVDRHTI